MMTEDLSEESFSLIERFVILMYEKTSDKDNIDEARKDSFTKKSRSLENIPPTKAALAQHILRAQIQTITWKNSCMKSPPAQDPAEFSWSRENGKWSPCWTKLPQAAKSCYELIKCGCTRGCRGNCKCSKAHLKCTALCTCGEDC